jgi:hypothetical protein
MGVRNPQEAQSGVDLSTFSEDILKIELSGPRRENLSIIDTPGIFRRPVEGRTTGKDMTLVKKMVESYIEDERTIILAVLPAGEDEENWEILSVSQLGLERSKKSLLTRLVSPRWQKRKMIKASEPWECKQAPIKSVNIS